MVPTEYKCQICGKGNLFSPQARVTHKMKEHPKLYSEKKRENKAPQYDCSFCPEQFEQKIKRKMHEINVHNEGKSDRVACKCGITFLTEKRLEFHKKTSCWLNEKTIEGFQEKKLAVYRPLKAENHKCDQCGKGFTYLSDLQRHVKLKSHMKDQYIGIRQKCAYCDNEYLASNLKAHVLAVHEKARTKCEFCFKSLSIFTFKIHMRNMHNL